MTGFVDNFEPYKLDVFKNGVRLPEINIEAKQRKELGLKETASNEDFLKKKIWAGYLNRLKEGKIKQSQQECIDRLKMEFSVFKSTGTIDYILLLMDIYLWCDSNNIWRGPARGCLSGNSKVLIDNKFVNIKEAILGNTINCYGKNDKITYLHKYKCDEDLIELNTYFSVPYKPAFTNDHKIFALKNPFGNRKSTKQGVRDLKTKLHLFDDTKLDWYKIKDLKQNDYVVRYVGRYEDVKDFNTIDLAPYADYYDDVFVYERVAINKCDPLAIKTIANITKLSESYLKDIKEYLQSNGKVNNKKRNLTKLVILTSYLESIDKKIEDFINFNGKNIRKYNRFLNVNYDLCYVLGLYVGDGWYADTRIGIGLHSENNLAQIDRLDKFFKNFHVYKCKHKKKKLIQFYVNSKIITKLFKKIIPDKGINKIIPQEYLNLPDHKIKGLLNGLIDSDGSINNKEGKRICFDNISINLIYQFRWLAEYFGNTCTINKRNQVGCNESYKVSYNEKIKQCSCGYNNGKYIYQKIRHVNKIKGDGFVYDLTIRNHPSYSTDSFIVHNSSGASFTLFCLGLNSVNSLDFDLNFTRFLSEARVRPKIIDGIQFADGKSMCDFDGDIQYNGRDAMIKRIENDYKGKTCKILTLQYLTGKTALKETVKSFLEYSEGEALELSSKIESLFGKVASLEASVCGEKDKDGKEKYKSIPEIIEFAKNNPRAFAIAKKIEGLLRGCGQHASGILLSYYPIDDILPKEMSSSGTDIVSGMDMNECLNVAVKCDVLGLRQIDTIKICCEHVGIQLSNIDLNDPVIYQYLRESDDFYGLFQIEDGLTKQATKKIKPQKFDHLVAILSISRPGAFKEIDNFAKYVATGERKSIHPEIDALLENSGSILLFQEQINSICQRVYKLSGTDADDVRRCIGKKDADGIKKWEPIIYKRGEENNIPKTATDYFWQVCNSSADYLFNQAHATSYAYLTCYTAYLKAKYPKEFFLGCLMMARYESNPTECYQKIQLELPRFNIKLLPPSINRMDADFSIEGNNIRSPLASIKGISDAALEKLKLFDQKNTNKFALMAAFEFAEIPLSVITPLVLSGAMDEYTKSRSKLLLEIETYRCLSVKEKNLVQNFGQQYNFDLLKIIKDMVENLKDAQGKPLIKSSRFETIKKKYEIYKKKYLLNTINEELSNYLFEQEYLGFAFSTNLKNIYQKYCPKLKTIKEINDIDSKDKFEKIQLAAQVVEVEKRISREKKTPYLALQVKDHTGIIKVLLMGNDKIINFKKFNGQELAEKQIIIINGAKKGDIIFMDADSSIQECNTIIKKSEIKETQNE